MGINDIHRYKKAKVIVPDLEASLAIVERAIADLAKYKRYTQIQRVLDALTTSRTMLVLQLKEQRRIIQNKGERDGD